LFFRLEQRESKWWIAGFQPQFDKTILTPRVGVDGFDKVFPGTFIVLMAGQYSEDAQTGPIRGDAIETLMNFCHLRAGFDAEAHCVFVRVCRVNTLPRMEGQQVGTRWVYFASENVNAAVFKNRCWLRQVRKETSARIAAMKKCELKGGIDCRTKKCSTADGEKVPY